MATTANNTKANATKGKVAPAPTGATVNNGQAPTQTPTGTKAAQVAAPQVALYVLGPWPAQQRGHRAYARAVAAQLTKANPKGFTLAQFKAALVANAAASPLAPPQGGWQGHNMPTWAANVKQGWLTMANA